MIQQSNSKWKLGLFLVTGILIFVVTVYFIGKNKNLFGNTFLLKSQFKNVSGLKIGNNVRFSGINIGTVKNIDFVSDSSIVVVSIIESDVQKYIKTDAFATIGSDGLMGDKVLSISPGTASKEIVTDNSFIKSSKAIELDDLMKGLKKSVDNAANITNELVVFTKKLNNNNGVLSRLMTDQKFASSLTNTLSNLELSSSNFKTFTKKMNNKNGVLSKLVSDDKLGKSLDSTIINVQKASKGIIEIEAAAKNNFLLRGYFKKQKKAQEKKKAEAEKQK